jgi:hypothetical protein
MKSTIFILLSLLFLSGCSARNTLLPSAKEIRVYDDLPAHLQCRYIDEIVGSEANVMTYLFVSNYDITVGARNALRNKALKLGGNTVEVQDADFVYATSTVFIGQVYDCKER